MDAGVAFDRNTFFALFGSYMLGMIVLGWWVSRGNKSGDDFLLGGRRVPFLLVLGTTIATMVGTGSSMGAVGAAYDNGWAGALFALGGALGLLFLAKFFADVRRYQFMTLSEEISFYYGGSRWIKAMVAVIIFFASVGWLGTHILGGALYLNWIAGVDMTWAKILVASGFTIYVIIGGYTAVVWTDTIQAVVLFVGFLLTAVLCLNRLDAWEQPAVLFQSEQFRFLEGSQIFASLSVVVSIFISVATVPSFRQRIYSSRDTATLRRSYYLSSMLYLMFAVIPVIIGITAFRELPPLAEKDHAFPELVAQILPAWAGIIVLIAGLSAVISSASSDAIAGTSILLRDIYILLAGRMPPAEKTVLYSRYGAMITSAFAVLFSLLSNDIFAYIKDMVGIVMSGMFVCCILGKFWQRSTWQGGVAALVAGSTTAMALIMLASEEVRAQLGGVTIPAVVVSTLCSVIVSLLTPPNRVTDEEALASLEAERRAFGGSKP